MSAKKKPMGRPRAGGLGAQARTVRVIVKATPAESKAWKLAAKAAGLPVAVWLAKPRRAELEGKR